MLAIRMREGYAIEKLYCSEKTLKFIMIMVWNQQVTFEYHITFSYIIEAEKPM